jgi:hypothetical protein
MLPLHEPPRQRATVSPPGIEPNVEATADRLALGVLGESPLLLSLPVGQK